MDQTKLRQLAAPSQSTDLLLGLQRGGNALKMICKRSHLAKANDRD